MSPTELKTAWNAKWRRILDDHDHRMSHPEAYRVQCHWETRDMLAAGVIDEMEKLEMDDLADAAYWHAVEELIITGDQYQHGAHYDIMPKAGGETVGRIISNTYYSAAGPGRDGFDGKVVCDKRGMRLVFRHGNEPWVMTGLLLTSSSGEVYDLVQTAQTINGIVYANIDDPYCYRALVDCAQVALESHDFNTYRKAVRFSCPRTSKSAPSALIGLGGERIAPHVEETGSCASCLVTQVPRHKRRLPLRSAPVTRHCR